MSMGKILMCKCYPGISEDRGNSLSLITNQLSTGWLRSSCQIWISERGGKFANAETVISLHLDNDLLLFQCIQNKSSTRLKTGYETCHKLRINPGEAVRSYSFQSFESETVLQKYIIASQFLLVHQSVESRWAVRISRAVLGDLFQSWIMRCWNSTEHNFCLLIKMDLVNCMST